MSETRVTTRFIADEAITRDKLNVSTAGQAVIAKIKKGEGINISSNGVDEGTGDVELSIDFNFIGSLQQDEQLIGEVDGINKIFATSVPYCPGTITIFRNGLKYSNFIEVADSDTLIELEEAPRSDGITDKIEATYLKKTILKF